MTKCVAWPLALVLVLLILTTPTSLSNIQSHQAHSPSQLLSPSLLELEVVVVLPSPSPRASRLTRTLSRTLNSLTAADLVSQLDFPEKNLTWRVAPFFLSPPEVGASLRERLIQGQSSDDDEEDDDEEEEETGYFGDEGGKGQGQVEGQGQPWTFSPPLLPQLCDFLGRGRALAVVSLVPEAYGQRLLSLLTASLHVPLVAQSALTTLKVGHFPGNFLRVVCGFF